MQIIRRHFTLSDALLSGSDVAVISLWSLRRKSGNISWINVLSSNKYFSFIAKVQNAYCYFISTYLQIQTSFEMSEKYENDAINMRVIGESLPGASSLPTPPDERPYLQAERITCWVLFGLRWQWCALMLCVLAVVMQVRLSFVCCFCFVCMRIRIEQMFACVRFSPRTLWMYFHICL